jgi:hypothetical protein
MQVDNRLHSNCDMGAGTDGLQLHHRDYVSLEGHSRVGSDYVALYLTSLFKSPHMRRGKHTNDAHTNEA